MAKSQIEAYTAGWEQRLDTVESYKLAARVPARVIDQMSPHGSTSNSEKVLPILPVAIFGGYQPNVNLVDQFGRLEGMALPFAFHEVMRQPAQVRVQAAEKFIFRLCCALPPLMQELGDFSNLLRHSYL